MRIVPSTKKDYAHVEWDNEEEKQIKESKGRVLASKRDSESLKGLRIEISERDLVPDHVRSSLKEGRFFIVE